MVNDHKYGISVVEDSIEGHNAIRVDYHFEADDGSLVHGLTKLNTDAFQVFGIIGNGVIEKFNPIPEIVYFVLKKRLCTSIDESGNQQFDEKQFEQKKTIYGRLRDKFATELQYHKWGAVDGGDQVFFVCRTSDIKKAVIAFYEGQA